MLAESVVAPSLPALSWFARLRKGELRATVVHGSAVEVGGGRCVEGAWSGNFAEGGFANALTFTGTGVSPVGDGLLFATPTHTLEALYLIRKADTAWCANSLALLLAATGESLDLGYPYYDLDLASVIDGLKSYRRTLSTATGAMARIFYHCNFLLKPDLTLSEEPKKSPPPFSDFCAYYRFLAAEVGAVCRNAADLARRFRYTPVTTISSGFDSPACAVLARTAGCTTAVTLSHARSSFADTRDSGARVAALLGLSVVERDPEDALRRDDLEEARFISSGMGGDDLPFAVFEDLLPGKILLTGFHGDAVWSRIDHPVTGEIVRGDRSGSSMENWRQEVGFLNLPVPFIGCLQQPSIGAISNSPEMAAWSVAPDPYDRPIPRRIVECAGIPRESFARVKRAAATPYQDVDAENPPLRAVLTAAAEASYHEFLAANRLRPALHRRLENKFLRTLDVLGRLTFLPRDRHLVPRRFWKPLGESSYALHWAMSRMCGDLRSALPVEALRSE